MGPLALVFSPDVSMALPGREALPSLRHRVNLLGISASPHILGMSSPFHQSWPPRLQQQHFATHHPPCVGKSISVHHGIDGSGLFGIIFV